MSAMDQSGLKFDLFAKSSSSFMFKNITKIICETNIICNLSFSTHFKNCWKKSLSELVIGNSLKIQKLFECLVNLNHTDTHIVHRLWQDEICVWCVGVLWSCSCGVLCCCGVLLCSYVLCLVSCVLCLVVCAV